GYDSLREVCGVFVDPTGEPLITELAARRDVATDFPVIQEVSRRLVTDTLLVAEIRRIAALVTGVDHAPAVAAVGEIMIASPVYRSYLPEGDQHLADAIGRARVTRPDLMPALDAIDLQLHAVPDGELATRLQQTSGMVVAKGTEDTAFYRYTRFS